jgi:hypothetical protein
MTASQLREGVKMVHALRRSSSYVLESCARDYEGREIVEGMRIALSCLTLPMTSRAWQPPCLPRWHTRVCDDGFSVTSAASRFPSRVA